MQNKIDQFIAQKTPFCLLNQATLPNAPLLFPGSFNPFHEGHKNLLKIAEHITKKQGILELSIQNVDKPTLSANAIATRLKQIESQPILLTRAPTFLEKAALFPRAHFILGFDTAERLLSPRYHANIPQMLQTFQSLEIHFIVAGRLHQKTFQTLENLSVPEKYKELFSAIPETLFRADVSSTQLRDSKPLDR